MENPYRILGVYANSPKKDIVANKGRATAFLRVGKAVEYPLDLKGILPPISRTLEMFDKAEAHLAIAKEQISYAQFWFLKMTPLDDVAFNHLVAGKITDALNIWAKQPTLSSLQNRAICQILLNNLSSAFTLIEMLYERFGDAYINKVDANSTFKMTGTELLHQFIDTLGAEVGMQNLIDCTFGTTREYISSQTVGPLISKISAQIERAKRVDHKDSKARLEAARNLVRNTKESLNHLKQILSVDDALYIMIADKLGLEILQCGIDYFNNSNEEGRHDTAMKVQKYAQGVVAGALAKQRCDENVKILQELIDKLPPKEVKEEQEHLQQLIAMFMLLSADMDDVLKFLDDTSADLVGIKEKLGNVHDFYIKQATLVAQVALSKSIDVLNEVQEQELPKLNGNERESAIEIVSHAFAASWKSMLWIELIDADEDFKTKRLTPNKKSLKKILDQVDAFKEYDAVSRLFGGMFSVFEGCARNVKVDKYVYFTESEMYGVCNTILTCQKYIKKFPQGKHIHNVREKLALLKDDQSFSNAKTLKDLQSYLINYPNGRHSQEVKTKIKRIEEEQRKQREKEIQELIEQISSCSTISRCLVVRDKCKKYSSDSLNKELDNKAFSLCSSSDDYKQYLSAFGEAALHKTVAESILKRKKLVKKATIAILWIVSSILLGSIIVYAIKESERQQAQRIEARNARFDQLSLYMDADSCLRFLADYPDCTTEMRDSVQTMLLSVVDKNADELIASNPSEEELLEFYYKFLNISGVDTKDAVEKVKAKWDEIEQEKEREEQRRVEDLQRAREREEQEKYGTDAKAWATAKTENTIESYREYLKRYPKGSHVEEADKYIIDLEVQSVISSGDYGLLPPSQKISYGTGRRSTVSLTNNSSQTITIRYSGVKSMKIVLSSGETRSIILPSSTYKVVATATGVRSFYGTEDLTGGDYESVYYISTSRY
ncbi:MAG: hypothetical protein IJ887_04440 [Prevotella sp.]|nr:hypothetical protein [Prevotella sp.]